MPVLLFTAINAALIIRCVFLPDYIVTDNFILIICLWYGFDTFNN